MAEPIISPVAGPWPKAPNSDSGGDGSKNMAPARSNVVLMIRIPKTLFLGCAHTMEVLRSIYAVNVDLTTVFVLFDAHLIRILFKLKSLPDLAYTAVSWIFTG
jgi:hypothetical protein